MVNYQLGKIYKLVDNTNGNIYVGSTSQTTLAQRLSEHSSKYKAYARSMTHYVSSFEIIKNGNYDMILLEKFPCETKDELHARERYYIETLKCVNKELPGRTKKERSKTYREANKEHRKAYNEANKEAIKEQTKGYNEVNKEAIKERRKVYNEANKDKINEYNRLRYRNKNQALKHSTSPSSQD